MKWHLYIYVLYKKKRKKRHFFATFAKKISLGNLYGICGCWNIFKKKKVKYYKKKKFNEKKMKMLIANQE